VQAIEAVRNSIFDVVLMDGSMPDVDGFTAAREIRTMEASEQRDRLPIVALTAMWWAQAPRPGVTQAWMTSFTNRSPWPN